MHPMKRGLYWDVFDCAGSLYTDQEIQRCDSIDHEPNEVDFDGFYVPNVDEHIFVDDAAVAGEVLQVATRRLRSDGGDSLLPDAIILECRAAICELTEGW